ncbi:MAG: hypothetical protein JXB32_04695 [Deltaproteobacteria bacterium]|nr:hypothetical protein [Deltaproteobacteria bacterium]
MPEQEGQDVVMTVAGRDTVLRDSDGESTELGVPAGTFDRTCRDPSPNGYCPWIPCGDFRDRCVPVGRHVYAITGYRYERSWGIYVRDSGTACLRECRPVAWLDARVDDDDVRLTLLTTVAGSLYRLASSDTTPTRTLVGTIDPAGLPSRCRQTLVETECCSPCTVVVDRCPNAGSLHESLGYEFAPLSGDPSASTGYLFVAPAAAGCTSGWELQDVDPDISMCPPAPDGDSDATDEGGSDAEDEDAEAEDAEADDAGADDREAREAVDGDLDDGVEAGGGGCTCTVALVVRPELLALCALVALGFLALRRE